MTQTTQAGVFNRAVVDIGPTATGSWTSLSGHGAAVAPSGGDVPHSDFHTFDGLDPIVGHGKPASCGLEVRFAYTQEDAGPYNVVRAYYKSQTGTFVRYAALGSATGSSREWLTTGESPITSFLEPGGEANSADIIPCQFSLAFDGFTKSDIA